MHVQSHTIQGLPCMLGNFSCFLFADFFKIFFRIIFSEIPSVSNSLDPDQARHFVVPDLDPNCLQRVSDSVYLTNAMTT